MADSVRLASTSDSGPGPVTLMEVLDHVTDPADVLRALCTTGAVLNATLIISVRAATAAASSGDEPRGVLSRYTIAGLRLLLMRFQLTITSASNQGALIHVEAINKRPVTGDARDGKQGSEEVVEVLAEQVRVLRDQLASSRDRFVKARRELLNFHASRLFQLGLLLNGKPGTVSTVLNAFRLLMPASLRSPKPADPRVLDQAFTAREGYQVQVPKSVGSYRPRILHAIANVMTGGSSQLVVDLIEHLGGDYEQEVLTGFEPVPPAYRSLPVIHVPEPVEPRAIDAVIKKFQPALIHVHYWGDVDEAWYAMVFEAAARARVPVIQNINTPVEPYRIPTARNVFVSHYVHRIFGDSDPQASVVYPGSNLGVFSRSANDTGPDDCVGMVYRLERDKLNEASIDCFIEIVRRRPATRALIVGGGHFLELYRARVESEGMSESFEFAGTVPYSELRAFYQKMSVFIAPVWNESFGQVAIFAMNMGIPVVGYEVGALPEIIDDSRLVAPRSSAQTLAEIAVALLEDRELRIQIGRRNRVRAEKLFSIEAMVAHYRDLYAGVLQRKP